MAPTLWTPSEAARHAIDYFNSLPQEQRSRLVPLLEEYRRRGHLEARTEVARALEKMDDQRRLVGRLIEDGGEKAKRVANA